MKSRKDGTHHIVVLEMGEEVVQSLTDYCVRERLHAAFFQGVGAVKHVQVGYYDMPSKEYVFKLQPGPFEVASLQGNLTIVDDTPFIHLHAVLSRMDDSLQCIGAHLKAATVSVTLEVIVTPLTVPVARKYDENIGLNLLDI